VTEINDWLGGPRPTSGETVVPPIKEAAKPGAGKNGKAGDKNAAAKTGGKKSAASDPSTRKAKNETSTSRSAPTGKPPSTESQ